MPTQAPTGSTSLSRLLTAIFERAPGSRAAAAKRRREGGRAVAPDRERGIREGESIATAERQLVANGNTLFAIDNLAAQLARA